MSVINVTKMWSKTGGSFTSEKYDQFASKYAITEGYQVLAEIGDDITVIAQASGVPQYGEQHESGLSAFVNSVNPTPLGPCFWLVLVNYEGENPYTGNVEVEWTDTTTTEAIDRDYDGFAIVTANGEQVDGLTMDVSDQVVQISRKFLTINTKTVAAYRMATNSDTFLGWPPGTARLVGFSAKNQFKFGAAQELWNVTARIQFREPYYNTTPEEAWHKRWRHEGMYVSVGGVFGNFVVRRATDELGQETTKPVLLKLDGTQETDPEAAVFIHTKVYGSLPYSGLGLI